MALFEPFYPDRAKDGLTGFSTHHFNDEFANGTDISEAGIMMLLMHEPGHLKPNDSEFANIHGGPVWKNEVNIIAAGLMEANLHFGWGLSSQDIDDLAIFGMYGSIDGRSKIPLHVAKYIKSRSGLGDEITYDSQEFQDAFNDWQNNVNKIVFEN